MRQLKKPTMFKANNKLTHMETTKDSSSCSTQIDFKFKPQARVGMAPMLEICIYAFWQRLFQMFHFMFSVESVRLVYLYCIRFMASF